jgi:hypothetical protein
MSAVGTWAWAQATGGRLGRRDRIQLLRQGVFARLSRMPSQWRSKVLGERVSLTLPNPPDSGLAREAEELVSAVSSPALYGHCQRTWAFAALFAQRDRVAYDQELLYLACLMHDLGLTRKYDGRDPTAGCFAVEGARAAQAMLCGHGEPDDRARRVAEAISLHLNITVPARLGVEAHLLSKGVSLDAAGRRMHQIVPAMTETVLARWPRDGFAAELSASTTRQAKIRPSSRSALLHRLGFVGLIDGNPLDRVQAHG